MVCKFSNGDKVLINDTAEVAFEYIGHTVTVLDIVLVRLRRTNPNEYTDTCKATIQLEDETILDGVPESELSPV